MTATPDNPKAGEKNGTKKTPQSPASKKVTKKKTAAKKAAKKKVAKKTPPNNKKPKGPMLRVKVARGDGFRRAGFQFTQEPTNLVVADLTRDQVKALKKEPMLKVEEITE